MSSATRSIPQPQVQKTKGTSAATIPAELLKETIGGVPYYYKGYREVLENKTTLKHIMGCSSLQSLLIDYLLRVLYRSDDISENCHVFTNESGFHAGKNDNLSFDIALYGLDTLSGEAISNKYVQGVPPKVVFEVDANVELAEIPAIEAANDYVLFKTQRVLDLGAESVIWIFSNTRKVLIARKDEPWIIDDWRKPFEVLGAQFDIVPFLKKRGVEL